MAFDSPQNTPHDQTPPSWKDDWTLVVDLGVVFDVQGPHGKLGADEALHDLEGRLAAIPKQPKGQGGETVRLVVGALTAHDDKYDFNVYKLQDGQLQLLSSAPTLGLESDLRKLTSFASPRFRDEKMGLVINAHGTPTPGYLVGGDSGTSTVMQPDAFRSIVKEWVNKDPLGFDQRKTGDRKLEFLNLESCFGAKLGNLNFAAGLAKNVVASELTVHEGEFFSGSGGPDVTLNGQNVAKIYEDLVNQPKLSGYELAELAIADANAGANDRSVDGEKFSATPTLAHYDLGAPREQLAKSLDGLGAVLTASLANPAGRKQIDGIIDGIPDLWSDEDTPKPENAKYAGRDLQTFLDQLEIAVNNKSLADEGGAITRAIGTVRGAEKDFVKTLHAVKSGDEWYRTQFIDPEKLGGVSVSLPAESVRADASITSDDYSQTVGSDFSEAEAPNWRKFLTTLRDQH